VPAEGSIRLVVALAASLRRAGVAVSPERTALAIAALDRVDLSRADDVYWTLRQTLVSGRRGFAIFDEWFSPSSPDSHQPLRSSASQSDVLHDVDGDMSHQELYTEARPGWTAAETFRTKDFAAATADELCALVSLIAHLETFRPRRRSRRLEQSTRGRRLDLRRTLRASAAHGGEYFTPAVRRRTEVHRRAVFLCDISGSMAPYARPLLMFGHALMKSGRGVEVFAFGTRLTRLTGQLAAYDPDQALTAATETVADWSGGTRIGSSLRLFNERWGSRAVCRGAIVIIASDGWERDDPRVVEREMARLSRQAYAVIWVNPCKGDPAYQPLAAGMRAALPYVDRFVSGHNLASLEELTATIVSIRGRHSARAVLSAMRTP
jgi:uncharacterized protein